MGEESSTIDELMLRRAVMSSSMAMAVTDPHRPDNPIVFTNPAFSQLTHYEAAQILGRNCRFLQGPDTDPAAVAEIRHALDAKRDLQIDIRNYRSDGSRFVNRLFISPVLNVQGELVHFFASQLDATDVVVQDSIKRRREDVLRYLAGDLSHRLGSTIQVVQTLVSSTLASASSVVDASAAISARLVALGQVHRRINDNDWEAEDLESLAHQTIAPFRQHFADVQIEGPRLNLGAFLSLKTAAVLYELASNAMIKRAGETHKLRLAWSWDEHGGAQRLRLLWEETGSMRLTHVEKAKVHRTLCAIINDPCADVSLGAELDGGGLLCCIKAPLRGAEEAGAFAKS